MSKETEDPNRPWVTTQSEALGFTIRARKGTNDAYAEVEAYDDRYLQPGEEREDKPTIAGSVKWDGCSNLNVEQIHFCGRDDAVKLGEVLGAIYDAAESVIPLWDKEIAS
jgi:hypothetical protein